MKYKFFFFLSICILVAAPNTRAGVITFKPILSISTEFTDNFGHTYREERDNETSTIFTPGFSFGVSAKHMGLNLSYSPGYATYQETDRDANWRHNATLSFWKDLSKYTTLTVSDSYAQSDQPVYQLNYDVIGYVLIDNQLIPVVDTTLRRGRKEYRSNAAQASLTHRFGRQNTFSLSYLQSSFKELEIEGGNDNERYHPSLNITYWVTPRSGFDFSAGYTQGIFDNSRDYDIWNGAIKFNHKHTKRLQTYISYAHNIHRFDETAGKGYDYDMHVPSAGITYKIEESISLRLGGGYYFRKYKDRIEDDEDPFVDASISKSWSFPRGGGHLTGSAGLHQDDFGIEQGGLERYYGLGFKTDYSLTRRIRVSINASGRRNEYLDDPDDREDNWAQAGTSLGYTPLNGWFSISASYTYRLLDSTLEGSDYEENEFRVNLSLFPNYIYRHVY